MQPPKPCPQCHNDGWLLSIADGPQLTIKRCDLCNKYATDEEAKQQLDALAALLHVRWMETNK